MASTGDELEYLKSLRARLQAKIDELEKKAAPKLPPPNQPTEELRLILVGPPGAGTLPPLSAFTIADVHFCVLFGICCLFFLCTTCKLIFPQ